MNRAYEKAKVSRLAEGLGARPDFDDVRMRTIMLGVESARFRTEKEKMENGFGFM